MMALLPAAADRARTSRRRCTTASRAGGRSTCGDERERVGDAIDRLQIDTRARRQARRLSGGNQQKLTIARWLAAGFQVMLCFDPTRGIDVGTKRQIYALLRELADAGAAILLFTSELPEIQLVCDRVDRRSTSGAVSDRAARRGGRRGPPAARRARAVKGGGGVSAVAEAAVGRGRARSTAPHRPRHGWTIGVIALFVVLLIVEANSAPGLQLVRLPVAGRSPPCRSRSPRWPRR